MLLVMCICALGFAAVRLLALLHLVPRRVSVLYAAVPLHPLFGCLPWLVAVHTVHAWGLGHQSVPSWATRMAYDTFPFVSFALFLHAEACNVTATYDRQCCAGGHCSSTLVLAVALCEYALATWQRAPCVVGLLL
jgi:hypothetical protein